jgi:hypothetical protein
VPDRLEPAVAAEVVPFDQERVVRERAEHALGDGFQRALAHPAGAVIFAADVQGGCDVVGDALEHCSIGGDRGIGDGTEVVTT